MATREQLLQALTNADAAASAGDESAAADARQLAQMLKGMDAEGAQETPAAQGEPRVGMAEGLLQQFAGGGAMNFGDEAMGGIANAYAAIYDKLANTPAGEAMGLTGDSGITGEAINKDINITSATESIRDDMEDFEKRNKGAAIAANVAGGLTTGIAAPLKLLSAAPTTLKGIAALAGAEGTLMGAGSGEDLESRAKGAAIEGPLSAIMGPLAKVGIDKIAKNFKVPFTKDKSINQEAGELREQLDPTLDVEGVKKKAQEFYRVADESGFTLKPEYYNTYKDEMVKWMDQYNIKGKRFPMLGKAISEIKMMEEPNYQDLQGVKDMLVNAIRSPDKPRQQELAMEMTRSIDNIIDKMTPNDVGSGSAAGVAEAIEKGRNLWRQKSQGEILEQAQYKAVIADAVADQDNIDKALRQQIKPMLVNPKKRLQFDDETLEGLEKVVYGKKGMGALRTTAGLSPSESTARGFFPSLGAAGTGIAATGTGYGALLGIIPGLSGGIARKLANKITANEFDKLKKDVLNKGQLEVKQVVYELMKKHDLLRGATAAAGSAEASTQLNDLITGQ